jgi:hypothetical protein
MAVQKTARSVPQVVMVVTDGAQREAVAQLGDAEGVEVTTVGSVEEARAALSRIRSMAAAGGDSIEVEVGTSLEEASRALILATLRHAGGVRKRAAEMLGISLKTLYNRLVAYRANGELPGGMPQQGAGPQPRDDHR